MKATEKHKQQMKIYNKNHREQCRAYQRKYYATHKDYYKQYSRTRFKDMQQKIDSLSFIITRIEMLLVERINDVPETIAEVNEDKYILNKIYELKAGK